jgi:hypothetical protein
MIAASPWFGPLAVLISVNIVSITILSWRLLANMSKC